ncbi:hypothetical protein ACP4OV_003113 [Aristida adscensionis]
MLKRRYCSCAAHGFFFLPQLIPFVLLFSFPGLPLASTQSLPLNKTQEAIMRDISSLMNSVSIGNNRWNTADSNPCHWSGVRCTTSDSGSSLVVSNITLSNYRLSNNSIFAPICLLDTLRILDLSRNSFADLSAQFFASSSCSMKEGLRSLNLSSNSLTTSLGDVTGFQRLEVLDLSFNSFAGGNLSSELSTFPQLRSLNLSSNKVLGGVPTSMVGSLEELVLSRNQFSGGIPVGLFEYGNLTILDLSQNNLNGPVPDEFSKLPKLQALILSGNNLSGTIPKSLSNVKSMSRFSANQNNFTGPTPDGITRYLKMLDLNFNQLSGMIPSDLLSYPGLETVDLTSNRLVGDIPSNFSVNLYRLRLGTNLLNGSIPDSIGNASSLAYLELDNNNLSGDIPSQIGKCRELALLNLASNNLQGPVPSEISNLTKLEVLRLQGNNLSGSIPSVFSFLPNLGILNLSRNLFTGEIPQSIVNLTKLSNLNLEGNRISGVIPASIGKLGSLIELNLGNNALSGTIPPMPVSLSTSLDLSHNSLTGSIPSNIGFLRDLEILDLSYNNLSGSVPSSLVNLQSLTQLVLAYNQLSGPVPALPPHVLINISGNPGLTNISTGGRRKSRTLLIIVTIPLVGALVGCLVAAILMLSLSKRIYRAKDAEPSAEQGVAGSLRTMKANLNEWQITTFQALDFEGASIPQGLIEENLIGCGGSSHVYRVTFTNHYNGSTGVVAVKQIQNTGSLDEKLKREFESEANILGNIRHNNIVKLLCCISSAESRLLVYDYMDNGSLYDWLHGHALCGRHSKARVQATHCVPLDWPMRLRLAVGAAQGLYYMHHECSPPIIHRDIKTSNILLDSGFQAKVADFGLARILLQAGAPETMSAIAGSFGYMAPEYAYTRKVNEKVDVYSFGVVLLELTTGRKANDGSEHGCLAQWAWHHYQSGGSIPDATDKCIRYAGYPREIETVFRLAVKCTGSSPLSRPTMKDVLQILLRCSQQTHQKSRTERGLEWEAAPLFLPQRGSHWK